MPHDRTSTAAALPEDPIRAFSDDECIQRLARLVEHRDNKDLDEIVALIAHLAPPITPY